MQKTKNNLILLFIMLIMVSVFWGCKKTELEETAVISDGNAAAGYVRGKVLTDSGEMVTKPVIHIGLQRTHYPVIT